MRFMGIDSSKASFVAACIEDNATIVMKPRKFMQTCEGYDVFALELENLGGSEQVKTGMESTGHYGSHLFRFLRGKGYKVDMFNPILSGGGQSNVRNRKTDKDDAVKIAKIIRDGDYSPTLPVSKEMEQLRELCRQRRWIVESMADAKKRLRSLMDQVFPELEKLVSDFYGKAIFALMKIEPSAAGIAKLGVLQIRKVLETASRGRAPVDLAADIIKTAKGSICFNVDNTALSLCVRMMIDQIEFLQGQITALDEKIAPLYEKIEIPIKTVPGIGKVTGPIIVSELGALGNFAGSNMAKRILAYAGMDPRIRQSGEWQGKIKMTKRGSPTLRTALYQAAEMGRRCCPAFAEIYKKHREKGKHHSVAVSHVARKMIGAICGMYKTGSSFNVDKFSEKTA